jgi:PEP-CTERM motif
LGRAAQALDAFDLSARGTTFALVFAFTALRGSVLSKEIWMNSILKFVGAAASLLVASMGTAFATGTPIPEPGTIALVALGVAGVALFAKRKK